MQSSPPSPPQTSTEKTSEIARLYAMSEDLAKLSAENMQKDAALRDRLQSVYDRMDQLQPPQD